MWRFILISFAFLGWSFYVLSGGADYAPQAQSWQARAQLDDVRPLARPTHIEVASLAAADVAPVEQTGVTPQAPALNLPDPVKTSATRVAFDPATDTAPSFEADPAKTEALVAAPEATPAAVAASGEQELDIRHVTGTVVNMRDGPSTFYLAIGKLEQGAEVEVLADSGDGWLKIRATETEQIGWMADWLVTTGAN